MTIHQKLAAGFVLLCAGNLALHPDFFSSSLAVLASVVLYGLTVLVERRESEKLKAIEEKIQELESKMSNLNLARGLGR